MVRATLIGALTAIALVACGGGGGAGDARPMTKEAYVDEVREIEASAGVEATKLFTDLVVEDPVLSPAECADKAHELHGLLVEVVGRIENLRPPAEVEDLHDRFLVAARRSVDEIGDLAEEVDRGQVSCGRGFNERAYGLESTQQAQRVLEEYRTRGYLFSLNSE